MNIRRGQGSFTQISGEVDKPIEKDREWGTSHAEAEALRLSALRTKYLREDAQRKQEKARHAAAVRSGNVARISNAQGQQFLVPVARGGVSTAKEYGTSIDDYLNPERRRANAIADRNEKLELLRIRRAQEMGKLAEAAGLQKSRNDRQLRAIALSKQRTNAQKQADRKRQLTNQQKLEQKAKIQMEAKRQIEARNARMQAAVSVANEESAQVQRGQSRRYQAAAKQSKNGIYAVQNSTNGVASPFASFKSGGYTVPQMGGADFGSAPGSVNIDSTRLGIRKSSEVW